jgi:hypothetical protein
MLRRTPGIAGACNAADGDGSACGSTAINVDSLGLLVRFFVSTVPSVADERGAGLARFRA